jgi:Ca-activated chloride channel family protein
MSEQAAEQWLRKIPDDPGGLLRRKFIYQYRKRGGVDAEAQSW